MFSYTHASITYLMFIRKFLNDKMISILFLFFIIPFLNGCRVVETNSGPVRGISSDAKNVDAFLGIPFAEPPVGNLRFAKPVPKSPWTETFEANQLPPSCIQSTMGLLAMLSNVTTKVNEDCLYLNLWVPKKESTLKTIMVYIHGGALKSGSSSEKLYDGANLSEHGDVIVASMNYRLGSLGFFSAFIDEAAGNMGMYDQILALQWIKDNAKHFGGDPDNIVIFGESAGASCVSLHMVSPLSKNLFNRAILQSAAAIDPVYSDGNNMLRKASQRISKLTGCAINDEDQNDKAIVQCMKNLPPEKFVEADQALSKTPEKLMPRVGDEFLPENPTDLLRKGKFKDTEVLLGVNRDEFSMFLALQLGAKTGDMFANAFNVSSFNEIAAKQMVQSLAKNEHYGKIIQNYFKRVKEQSRYVYLTSVIDIIGDSQFTCPTMYFADFQSLKSHSVYFYLFDYRSPLSKFPEWVGVPHMDELQYVFGNTFLKEFSANEEELSKDMMDMWVAFSKTGNPNVPSGLNWPKYTFEDPKFLIINMRDKVGVKPDNFRCEAWRHLYDSTIDEEVIQNIKNSDNFFRQNVKNG